MVNYYCDICQNRRNCTVNCIDKMKDITYCVSSGKTKTANFVEI